VPFRRIQGLILQTSLTLTRSLLQRGVFELELEELIDVLVELRNEM
jgi:hypothetical protein